VEACEETTLQIVSERMYSYQLRAHIGSGYYCIESCGFGLALMIGICVLESDLTGFSVKDIALNLVHRC
jgi:hypothetical protein